MGQNLLKEGTSKAQPASSMCLQVSFYKMISAQVCLQWAACGVALTARERLDVQQSSRQPAVEKNLTYWTNCYYWIILNISTSYLVHLKCTKQNTQQQNTLQHNKIRIQFLAAQLERLVRLCCPQAAEAFLRQSHKCSELLSVMVTFRMMGVDGWIGRWVDSFSCSFS